MRRERVERAVILVLPLEGARVNSFSDSQLTGKLRRLFCMKLRIGGVMALCDDPKILPKYEELLLQDLLPP